LIIFAICVILPVPVDIP